MLHEGDAGFVLLRQGALALRDGAGKVLHDEFSVSSVVVKLATDSPMASTHVDDSGAQRVNAGPREAVDKMFDVEGIQISVGNEPECFC